jgi:uncharacterized protein (DUF2384 family)
MAASHVQQLDGLIAALGSQGAVARLLATESSRLSEWRRAGVTPRPATVQRIADAAAAVNVLQGRAGGDVNALRSLLETPLPELGGSRPSELIGSGRGAEIVMALAAPEPAVDREAAERDLVEALVALAVAARASAQALEAARER